MPQSEFIQLIGEHNAIDADIVEKTASAVQGILGLNHNSERVEECDQIGSMYGKWWVHHVRTGDSDSDGDRCEIMKLLLVLFEACQQYVYMQSTAAIICQIYSGQSTLTLGGIAYITAVNYRTNLRKNKTVYNGSSTKNVQCTVVVLL
jgi:hypothetical protein